MINDWAREIKERISTREVFEHYGIRINNRGYCKCPFHSGGNERTGSMVVYPAQRGYHCFACGETGDIIDFVCKMFNLTFRDACRKLNEDFCMGLDFDGEITPEKKKEISREAYLRRKQRQAFENERKRIFTAYYSALDRYTYYDRIIAEREVCGFNTENKVFNDDEYITAIKNIATAKYSLDCAESDLREFEKNRCS